MKMVLLDAQCGDHKQLSLILNPRDGDKCILKGQVSLYPATGRYQLMVKSIEQAGSGNLMHQFEQLKKKLDSERLI